MKRFICILLIVVALPSTATANWVDDWLNGVTTTASDPSYFKGQQRGYFDLGGFTARWQANIATSPFTIRPPRITSGCGGIDTFVGGFDFMGADYLVEQLQNILKNAPAVALDIALNELCSPCSNAVKWMREISDFLNGLQLESCRMSQITVAKLYDAGGFESQRVKALAQSSYMTETGITRFFYESDKKQKEGQNAPSPDKMLAKCDEKVKQVFATFSHGNKGYILANIANALSNNNSLYRDYMNLLRGLVGDVEIDRKNINDNANHNASYGYTYIPACTANDISKNYSNADKLMSKMLEGELFQMLPGSAICSETSVGTKLKDEVSTSLTRIVTAMANKTSFSTKEVDLINRSPIPIYSILKPAVASEQGYSTASVIKEAVAKGYAYAIIRDLVDQLGRDIAHVVTQVKRQTETPECKVSIYLDGIKLLEDKVIPNMSKLTKALYNEYANSLKSISAALALADKYKKTNEQFLKDVARLFSPAVAGRVVH